MGAYQDLIANPREILGRMNPHSVFGSSNCPATAASLINYLDTGQIVAAGGNFGMGFIIAEEAESHVAPNIGAIIRRLQHLPSERHLVVFGTDQPTTDSNAGDHHFFVLIKVDREVYYVDAYTRPPVFETGADAIRARTTQFRSFLYWEGGFHVRPGH
jgi:hypothetical protein